MPSSPENTLKRILLNKVLLTALLLQFVISFCVCRYVDDVISRIGRMFPDMTIELFRPNGNSAVLLVWICLQ